MGRMVWGEVGSFDCALRASLRMTVCGWGLKVKAECGDPSLSLRAWSTRLEIGRKESIPQGLKPRFFFGGGEGQG